MILLEEDIQQLRIIKTKGTGEQTFNLLSTSIAAFKSVSWQCQIQNHFLMQHVTIILLSKITPCWIIIYKLSLFSTLLKTWRDPQLERGGCLVGREGEGGQSKRLQVSVIKLLHSHVLVYKSQEAGKREGDTRAIRFFLLNLSPSPFFFSQVYNLKYNFTI